MTHPSCNLCRRDFFMHCQACALPYKNIKVQNLALNVNAIMRSIAIAQQHQFVAGDVSKTERTGWNAYARIRAPAG
jgi:hypothetical protein